jgi:hypothetical protein
MKWTEQEIQEQAQKWGQEDAPLRPEFRDAVLQALESAPRRSGDVRRFEASTAAERTPWLRAAAAAFLLVATGAGGFFVKSNTQTAPSETGGSLIAAAGLDEVRAAEKQYAEAISRLETSAGPILAAATDPTTPPREAALLAGYRNRLRSVDRAIENLRFHLEANPYHAKTRAALLKTYGEKSQLLNEVLKTRRGA